MLEKDCQTINTKASVSSNKQKIFPTPEAKILSSAPPGDWI